MVEGVYSSATGMLAAERMYEVVTQNLAHLRVPGYRRRVLSFEVYENPSGKAVPVVRELGIDFQPGPYEMTGNPLDVAIDGDGFFVLDGPDGPLYTRAGVFVLDPTGRLVTPAGYAVQGAGGPIVAPVQAGPVRILEDGTVVTGDQPVGRLRVVRFADPQRLRPVGPSLFTAPPDLPPEPIEQPVLVPGAREGSNVEPVTDLVHLILATRLYEASQRCLYTLQNALSEANNALS